jgi:hypothetical protein
MELEAYSLLVWASSCQHYLQLSLPSCLDESIRAVQVQEAVCERDRLTLYNACNSARKAHASAALMLGDSYNKGLPQSAHRSVSCTMWQLSASLYMRSALLHTLPNLAHLLAP